MSEAHWAGNILANCWFAELGNIDGNTEERLEDVGDNC
jgi:hypothetical protein